MSIKLVAIDLDGTTVIRKNNISEKNIAVIKSILQMGIKVIIATGRGTFTIGEVARQLEVDKYEMPIIAYNGGLIYNAKDNKVLKSVLLSKQQVISIFELSKQHKVTAWMYGADNFNSFASSRFSLFVKWMKNRTKTKVSIFKAQTHTVQGYKFIIRGNRKRMDKFLEQLRSIDNFSIFNWSYQKKTNKQKNTYNAEVNPVNINKQVALEWVANEWNIKQEQIMALGDGENDFEMIKWAGMGIAMKNADSMLFPVAKDVTDHHKKDGVAKAIEKHITNNLKV